MTQFNPTVPDTQDPNWLGWSKPISDIPADKTTGIAIAGAGDLLKATVDAGDQWIKRDIDNKAYAQVDPQRDALTTGLENVRLGQGAGAPTQLIQDKLPDVPGGVRNGIDRINTLTTARDQNGGSTGNTINDTYYSANITAIAKNLRAEYPGYREYIDQKVSEASGLPIANAYYKNLIADINHAAAAAGSSKDKIEPLLRDGIKEGDAGARENYMLYVSGKRTADEALKIYEGARVTDRQNKEARDNLSLSTGVMAQDQTMAKAGFSGVGNRIVAQYMDNMVVSTPMANGRTLGRYIEDVQSGAIKLSPPDAQASATIIDGIMKNVETDLYKQANATNAKGVSFAMRAGGISNLKDEITSQLLPLRNYLEAVTNEKLGIAKIAYNDTVALKSAVAREVYANPKVGKQSLMVNFSRNEFGETYTAAMTTDSFKMGMNDEMSKFYTGDLLNAVTGGALQPNKPAPSLNADIQTHKDNKVGENSDGTPNNEELKLFDNLIKIPQQIGDDKSPIGARLRIANYAFKPENIPLLRQFNMDYRDASGNMVEGKYGAFTKLTSPQVVKGMAELKDKGGAEGQQAWANFKNWSDISLREVIGNDLRNLSKLPMEGKDKVHVEWNFDKTSGTYFLRPLDASGKAELRKRDADPVKQGYLNQVHDTFDRINIGMRGVSRIAAVDGSNPSQFMMRAITTAGFTPGVNLTGIPKAMVDAIRNAHQDTVDKMKRREELQSKRAVGTALDE